MSELLDFWNIKYNLCSQTDFSLGALHTTNYGLQSFQYFAQKISNMIQTDLKNVNNLSDFTLKIKSWLAHGCPCNLCHAYICQVGYII